MSIYVSYLPVSFLADVFFLLGAGILHSIENATQLVHGTPRLAASHRTWFSISLINLVWHIGARIPSGRGMSSSELVASNCVARPAGCGTYFTSSRCALPVAPSANALPHFSISSTHLLKLGWPGIWSLGAAALLTSMPPGGVCCTAVGFGALIAARNYDSDGRLTSENDVTLSGATNSLDGACLLEGQVVQDNVWVGCSFVRSLCS